MEMSERFARRISVLDCLIVEAINETETRLVYTLDIGTTGVSSGYWHDWCILWILARLVYSVDTCNLGVCSGYLYASCTQCILVFLMNPAGNAIPGVSGVLYIQWVYPVCDCIQ